MMHAKSRSWKQQCPAAVVVLLVYTIFFYRASRTNWLDFDYPDDSFSAQPPTGAKHSEASKQQETLPCRNLPGGHDVLLSLKTGATEAHQKLPVYFKTTLRCARHYILFSDIEEVIQGEIVHDALDEIDEHTKDAYPDFQLYHQMQQWRAAGKEMNDLPGEDLYEKAWDPDKWKFLPIAEKAFKARPESTWFVFTEADTHFNWPNLLQWLALLDPEKPLYMGAQNWIESTIFAHGGAGYKVSNAAMRRVVEEYTSKRTYYNELTGTKWASDAVLAEAFMNAGVPVTWT